ncbi:NTP transferase domain-containing protein [uncultured Alsobacter sp.]|uniref:nucleotidyltransferase family protein n=1 Tax=uncultured Alsobacter sp. TaxID=1748258 RepID=UPI00345D5DE4
MRSQLAGIAAVVLAAGRSTRMGATNKLTADYDGKALVRRVAEAALETGASPVLVVCGHERDEVCACLDGLDVTVIENPAFAEGLSTSLRAGIAALPEDVDAAVVMLGDMPLVRPVHVRRLAAAFEAEPGGIAAVPVHDGEWGNPVILARALFAEVATLEGDAGARKLLQAHKDKVIEVPIGEDAVSTDIDTPEALEALRARP